MSNSEIATINAFNRRFSIKKSNRNVRKSLEYLSNTSTLARKFMAMSDINVDDYDLEDKKQFNDYMEKIDNSNKAVLDQQDLPFNFVKDLLKLNGKQIQMLEDFTPEKTKELADLISQEIMGTADDPKK